MTAVAATHHMLGSACHGQADYHSVIWLYKLAMDVLRELGVGYFEAETLTSPAETRLCPRRRSAAARLAVEQALAISANLYCPDDSAIRMKLSELMAAT